jgi:hypothetical protein
MMAPHSASGAIMPALIRSLNKIETETVVSVGRGRRSAVALTTPRRIAVGLLAIQLLIGVSLSRADDDTPEFPPNFLSFAAYIGSGIYTNGDRTIYIIRIPLSYQVRSETEHFLGIKPTLKTTFGFYDFNPSDILDFDFPDSVGIVTILPGVELPMLVTPNWRLTPFVDFGAGWDTETDDITLILGVGAYSRAEFPWKERTFILWNRLIRSQDFESDSDESQYFSLFEVATEVRVRAGRILKQRADVGTYIKGEFYFDQLFIDLVDGDPIEINRRYEVGVTYGSTEPSKLWIIPFPRLGLGYRFGQGNTGIRLIFSYAY